MYSSAYIPIPIAKSDSIAIQCGRPADCLNEGLDLQSQSKEFLIERVLVLERQLKIRNRDCTRLLMERHDRQKNDREPWDRVQYLENEIQRLQRENEALQAFRQNASREPRYTPLQNSSRLTPSPGRIENRVTIYSTELGPQVVFDSGVSVDGVECGSFPRDRREFSLAGRSHNYGRYAGDDEAHLEARLRSM